MRLAAIHASRITALIEVSDLIRDGRVFIPDLINAIVARFEFRKFPSDPASFGQAGGLVFEIGKWEGLAVYKLSLFNDGIVLETTATTEETERALFEILSWSTQVGLVFERNMINRLIVGSTVAVYLDVNLDDLHPILRTISETCSDAASQMLTVPLAYRTAGISVSPSTLTSKVMPTTFTIERRLDVPDSQNKYFSNAPLHTSHHLKALEDFERALQARGGRNTHRG